MRKTIRRLTIEIMSDDNEWLKYKFKQMAEDIYNAPLDAYFEIVLHPQETTEEAIKKIARTET